MHNFYDQLRPDKRGERGRDTGKCEQAKALIEDRLLSPSSSGQELRVVKRQCLYHHLEKSTFWLKTPSRTAFVKLDRVGGQEEIAVEGKLSEVAEGI